MGSCFVRGLSGGDLPWWVQILLKSTYRHRNIMLTSSHRCNDSPLQEVIVDSAQSSVKRTQASRDLYNRHARWVIQQIGKSIFNAEDVQDIAQNVWMMVLQPEKLGNDYNSMGHFETYRQIAV